MLIIIGGLPGTGKTTIARELARKLDAVHLRIDSIEQAIFGSAPTNMSLDDTGYRVAYAVAEDNLVVGRTVIADSVNPLPITRDAWVEVANRARVRAVEIEVTCSDADEHRRRVEMRTADIPGHRLPTWQEVVSRDYHPWDRKHIAIDTAHRSVEQNVKMIRAALLWRMRRGLKVR
jgi:predicted kinase